MRSLNSGARKEPWRVGSSQPSWKRPYAFVVSFSFSFIFPLLWFVLRRSKCSEWLLLGVATTNKSVVVSSRRCLMLALRVRESWLSVQGCAKLPMKQRKDWNDKVVKDSNLKPALSWQHVQAHLTSNARVTQNFFKVGEVASTGGCVAAPIWPHGALRRSFWWSLINDVSDSISLSQAVCKPCTQTLSTKHNNAIYIFWDFF